MVDVAITRCPGYEDCEANLTRCLDLLGGIGSFVNEGDRVLLKLNMLRATDPEEAVTTHPEMLRAMIKAVRSVDATPVVGDSPGFGSFSHVAEKTGIAQLCRDEQVEFMELDEPVKKRNEKGRYQFFEVSQRLYDVDKVINMPKLKTHILTGFTGAVKNLYGCIPGKTKAYMHVTIQDPHDFSGMLVDLLGIVKPTLNVMDAIIGMEGKGPNAGDPRRIGLILASPDALALDRIATDVVRLKDIPLFEEAAKRRIPSAKGKDIKVLGNQVDECRIDDFKPAREAHIPRALAKVAKGLFSSRPIVIPDACIGCGHCAKVCPKKAIEMKDKHPVFSYKECIRCFCCHELCPKKAIDIQPSVPIRVLTRIRSLFR